MYKISAAILAGFLASTLASAMPITYTSWLADDEWTYGTASDVTTYFRFTADPASLPYINVHVEGMNGQYNLSIYTGLFGDTDELPPLASIASLYINTSYYGSWVAPLNAGDYTLSLNTGEGKPYSLRMGGLLNPVEPERVSEPASLALLGLGLASLVLSRRKSAAMG
jgi:hypothetical protein